MSVVQKKASAHKAFTLVELLVVIGIIALLISILLPALNAARENAKTVQCAANMKQISTAMLMYISENNGYVPAGGHFKQMTSTGQPEFGTTPGNNSKLALAERLVLANVIETPFRAPTAGMDGWRANFPKTGPVGVFLCPSNEPVTGNTSTESGIWSYGMTIESSPQTQGSLSTTTTPVCDPGQEFLRHPVVAATPNYIKGWVKVSYWKPDKIVLVELLQSASSPIPFNTNQIATRHPLSAPGVRTGGNYMFADGHVEYSREYYKFDASNGTTTPQQIIFHRYWDHGPATANNWD
jgi:prepilin-type N-terminal cleavage/methylation domain-containing protein/prepilin-type processing-associated H-X9-DG protein